MRTVIPIIIIGYLALVGIALYLDRVHWREPIPPGADCPQEREGGRDGHSPLGFLIGRDGRGGDPRFLGYIFAGQPRVQAGLFDKRAEIIVDKSSLSHKAML